MLKIIQKLIVHDIEVESGLMDNFKMLAKNKSKLSEVFTLTKSRLSSIEKCFILHNRRAQRNFK